MHFKSDMERREFLKKFSILSSSVSLVFFNCIHAAYGPPEPEKFFVSGIYFIDAGDTSVTLKDAAEVAAGAAFEIQFTKNMNDRCIKNIHFFSEENEVIDFNSSWKSDQKLSLSPMVSLRFAFGYKLEVDKDAVSSEGNKIELNDAAIAEFTTTHVELNTEAFSVKKDEEAIIDIKTVFKSKNTPAPESEWQFITWQSEDDLIASVDTAGKVQGISEGVTIIKAEITVNNVSHTGSCKVTVES